ncbi:MAG: sensor histidine kinase [Magnetococcales bacterium]|nr:sensor histidine kinase [Magnetococcales bacterium]
MIVKSTTQSPRSWLDRRGWNLETRLIFWSSLLFWLSLSAILAVVLLGIPNTSFHGRIHQTRTQMFHKLALVASLHKQYMEDWLLDKQQDIRAFSDHPLFIDDPSQRAIDPTGQSIRAHLQAIVDGYPEFSFLEWVSISRQIVISTANPDVKPLVYDQFIRNALLAGKGYMGRARLLSKDQTPIFRISYPVLDADGRVKAMLVGAIRSDVLLSRLFDAGDTLGRSGDVLLVDDQGFFINRPKYTFPDGTFVQPLHSQMPGILARLAVEGHEGVMDALDYRGVSVIGATRHLRLSPNWGMGFVVKIDKKELYDPLLQEVIALVGVGAMVFFLLIVLYSFMVHRQTQLLKILSRSAARFSADDLSVRTGIHGRDDVGQLGEAFDRMAGRIQSSLGDVKREMLEHKRTALELSQANDELKNFAYIVSHDLRSPMLSIQGFTEELQLDLNELEQLITVGMADDSDALPDNVAALLRSRIPEDMRFIRSSIDKMDRLVQAVLKISRLGRKVLQYETVDLGALVANNVASLGFGIKESAITVQVDPLPQVITDRDAMDQIIGNLLSNAIKYLDPIRPGVVRIFGEYHALDQGVTLVIEDNGRGMAEADIPKIFTMFQRVGRQDTSGDGIGLSCARTLVRRLGGTIGCQSTLGAGTTFRIAIPAVPPGHEII